MRSNTDPPGRPALRPRGRLDLRRDNTPAAGLPRGVIVLLGTACLVVVVGGMRITADLLAPVFLALMLTVTVSPIAVWLCRHRVPAWIAMLANVTVVYLVLVALGAALALSLARLVDLMPTYQEQFTQLRADLIEQLGRAGITEPQVRELVNQVVDPGAVAGVVEYLFGGLAGVLSNTVFLLAVLLFMCLDAVSFPARLAESATQRPQVIGALRSFAGGTRRYLWVTTVFGLIVAVVDTLGLWALGIPLPVLWGLLSFITNYIPNVGFVVGLIPPALLGLLQGGPTEMLKVIALYCVVNFVIQSVIQPKIIGDAVGLSATVSFLSLIFWGWVLGPLGALLAIPMSLLAKGLLVDIDPASQWINSLLSGGPAPADAPEPAATPEPDGTVLDSTVPDSTVPGGTVPDSTVPGGTVPESVTEPKARAEPD